MFRSIKIIKGFSKVASTASVMVGLKYLGNLNQETLTAVAGACGMSSGVMVGFATLGESLTSKLLGKQVDAFGKYFNNESLQDFNEIILQTYEKTISTLIKSEIEAKAAEPLWLKSYNLLAGEISDKRIRRIEIRNILRALDRFYKDPSNQSLVSATGSYGTIEKWIDRLMHSLEMDYELRNNFIREFNKNFHASLQHNEKFRTSYFKHLLEFMISRVEQIDKHISMLRTVARKTNNSIDLILSSLADHDSTSVKIKDIQDLQLVHQQWLESRFQSIESQLREVTKPGYNKWIPYLCDEMEDNKHPGFRFDYKVSYTDFTGRNRELSDLDEFLEIDGNFQWWTVTGAGGSGKSRLAKEFCNSARAEGWHAGFYRVDESDNWGAFSTDFDTLIVIDYAFANKKFVEDRIISLHKRRKMFSQKVRILLLDRMMEQEWEKDNLAIEMNNSRYQDQPLKLHQRDHDLRWPIIIEAAKKINIRAAESITNKKEEILESLEAIDPQNRPLYAFFAGVALAETGNIRNWDTNQLVEFHLKRLERNIWSKIVGYDDQAKELQLLLTYNIMTRYLPKSGLQQVQDALAIKLNTGVYCQIAELEHYGSGQRLCGIQPDILGEHFIYKYLKNLIQNEEHSKVLTLHQLAWENAPEEAWAVYSRLYMDYFLPSDDQSKINSAHTELMNVLYHSWNPKLLSESQAGYVARLLASLIRIRGAANASKSESLYLHLINSFREQFPNDPIVASYYCWACYDVIAYQNNFDSFQGKRNKYFRIVESIYLRFSQQVFSNILADFYCLFISKIYSKDQEEIRIQFNKINQLIPQISEDHGLLSRICNAIKDKLWNVHINNIKSKKSSNIVIKELYLEPLVALQKKYTKLPFIAENLTEALVWVVKPGSVSTETRSMYFNLFAEAMQNFPSNIHIHTSYLKLLEKFLNFYSPTLFRQALTKQNLLQNKYEEASGILLNILQLRSYLRKPIENQSFAKSILQHINFLTRERKLTFEGQLIASDLILLIFKSRLLDESISALDYFAVLRKMKQTLPANKTIDRNFRDLMICHFYSHKDLTLIFEEATKICEDYGETLVSNINTTDFTETLKRDLGKLTSDKKIALINIVLWHELVRRHQLGADHLNGYLDVFKKGLVNQLCGENYSLIPRLLGMLPDPESIKTSKYYDDYRYEYKVLKRIELSLENIEMFNFTDGNDVMLYTFMQNPSGVLTEPMKEIMKPKSGVISLIDMDNSRGRLVFFI